MNKARYVNHRIPIYSAVVFSSCVPVPICCVAFATLDKSSCWRCCCWDMLDTYSCSVEHFSDQSLLQVWWHSTRCLGNLHICKDAFLCPYHASDRYNHTYDLTLEYKMLDYYGLCLTIFAPPICIMPFLHLHFSSSTSLGSLV